MKKYECLYIVNINFDSEGTSAVVARVDELIKNSGAKVVNTLHWGKRKLAYAINKERYGSYVLVHFEGENPDITELQREFEIEPGILHYMAIRLDEFPDFETLSVPQEFESDRRRSSTQGGRRPRRYEEETAPAPAPAVEAETAKPEAEEADAAPENTEDSPAAETSDSVEEPAAEDADTANSSAAE